MLAKNSEKLSRLGALGFWDYYWLWWPEQRVDLHALCSTIF